MTTDPTLSDHFREAFRRHPAGVALITADPGDGPVAMTVSSLISVSAAPPVVGFSLSAKSGSAAALLRAETMVIHLLRFADLDLAMLGATSGAERFGAGVAWERLPGGEPRYSTVSTWFRAKAVGVLPLEGAHLLAAEILDGHVDHGAGPHPEADSLVYMDRRWHRLHEALGQVA